MHGHVVASAISANSETESALPSPSSSSDKTIDKWLKRPLSGGGKLTLFNRKYIAWSLTPCRVYEGATQHGKMREPWKKSNSRFERPLKITVDFGAFLGSTWYE